MGFKHNFKKCKIGTPFWNSRVLGLWVSIWTFNPTPSLYCPNPKMCFSILDHGFFGRTGHAWIWFRELGQILGTWHGIGTQACPLQSGFAVLLSVSAQHGGSSAGWRVTSWEMLWLVSVCISICPSHHTLVRLGSSWALHWIMIMNNDNIMEGWRVPTKRDEKLILPTGKMRWSDLTLDLHKMSTEDNFKWFVEGILLVGTRQF